MIITQDQLKFRMHVSSHWKKPLLIVHRLWKCNANDKGERRNYAYRLEVPRWVQLVFDHWSSIFWDWRKEKMKNLSKFHFGFWKSLLVKKTRSLSRFLFRNNYRKGLLDHVSISKIAPFAKTIEGCFRRCLIDPRRSSMSWVCCLTRVFLAAWRCTCYPAACKKCVPLIPAWPDSAGLNRLSQKGPKRLAQVSEIFLEEKVKSVKNFSISKLMN